MQMVQISALLCILALPVCTHQQADDYVDPTDMINFDPASVKMKTTTKPSQSQTKGPVPPVETPPIQDQNVPPTETSPTPDKQTDRLADSICRQALVQQESFTSLFSQYANRLVHLLDSKVSSASNPVEVNLRLRVSRHDLVKLSKFGEGGDKMDIHVMHETLSHMIMYASDVLEPDATVSWLERKLGVSAAVWWMRHTTLEVLTQVLSIIVLFVVLLIVLSRIKLTWNLASWFLVLVYIVSAIFTWLELYQMEVAVQQKIVSQDVRTQCPGLRQDLSWLESLTSYFKSTFTFQDEKCKDLYESMVVSSLVRTNPMQAISLAVTKPLGIIATGIGQFLVNLLKDLPDQVQSLMIAMVVPFIGMVMLIYLRYLVRNLGILHIGPANDVPLITEERPRGDGLTYQDQQQPRSQPDAWPRSRSQSSSGCNISTDQRQPLTKGHKSSPLLSHEESHECFDDGNEDDVKELKEDSDEPVDGPTHDSLKRLQHCSENKDKKNVRFKTVSSDAATQTVVEKIEPVASKQVESVDMAANSLQFNSCGDGNISRQSDPTAIGSVVLEEQRLRLQQLTKADALSGSGQGLTDSDCTTDALSHSKLVSTDSDRLTDALSHSNSKLVSTDSDRLKDAFAHSELLSIDSDRLTDAFVHSELVSTDSDCLTGDLFTPAPPSLLDAEMSASFEILASGLSSNLEGRAAE